MRTVTITVTGEVQGVGFRYGLREAAEHAGAVGWVRNRRDGAVEARVTGDDETIEAVVRWAHEGPPASRVDQVRVEPDATAEPFPGFEIRPTA